MPNIDFSETIDIPYDSLSNEQRVAIKVLMEGKGLTNPIAQKINESTEICDAELVLIEQLDLDITPEQMSDIVYLLNKIKIALENLGLHTDKISGQSREVLGDFFERLSVAGNYTRIMKSLTGKDEEKYSFIFDSILGGGELCLDKIRKTLTCEDSISETVCDNIASGSGIKSLSQQLQNNPTIANSIIDCFLPSILQCVENLVSDDELNYCEAKKICEGYSAGTRVVEDVNNSPFYSDILQQIVASNELKESLKRIEAERIGIDAATRVTSEFFKDFPKVNIPESEEEGACRSDCCETELIQKSIYDCTSPEELTLDGPQGPPGAGGIHGIMGFIGPQGPDGGCDCQPPPPTGACCVDNSTCLQSTEYQCLQWGGEYWGDNTACEFIFCGACEENAHCDCNGCEFIPNSDNGCDSDGNCRDSQGNIVCQICCNGVCQCPCDDGGCRPCPICPDGTYQCQNGCCPIGHCCVDCVDNQCDSNYGSPTGCSCPASAPYCCSGICSPYICGECTHGQHSECPGDQCCCFGSCQTCPYEGDCFEPPEPCAGPADCINADDCCCEGQCVGCGSPACDGPPGSCDGDGSDGDDCPPGSCCCGGECAGCPCVPVHPCFDPSNPIVCAPGQHCELDEDGNPRCVWDDIWDECDNHGDCPVRFSCVNGFCVPNECACRFCKDTSEEGDGAYCCWNNCDCGDDECCNQCGGNLDCGASVCCHNGGGCDNDDAGEGNECSSCDDWLIDNGYSIPPPEGLPRNFDGDGNEIGRYAGTGTTNQSINDILHPFSSGGTYQMRSGTPCGDGDPMPCGCVPQCPGGGCPNCLVDGVQLGCCDEDETCCGGVHCCSYENCCGGNQCCTDEEECCGGSCCGGIGLNAGTCCNGNCCKYDSDTPCCGPAGVCIEPCPDGSCPTDSPCGNGCGCSAGADVCCDGNCCPETGMPCCLSNGGCPCPAGRVCCGLQGCCPLGEICCNGQCADPFSIECCDDNDGELCSNADGTHQKCCGVDSNPNATECCHLPDNTPICCENCCELRCGGEICEYNNNWIGYNPYCGWCGGTTYCGSCWPDIINWISANGLVYSGDCDCNCRDEMYQCTYDAGGPQNQKKFCCNDDQECCSGSPFGNCCPSGMSCCTAPEANPDGTTSKDCCIGGCCCWSKNVAGVWSATCCLSDEVCCSCPDEGTGYPQGSCIPNNTCNLNTGCGGENNEPEECMQSCQNWEVDPTGNTWDCCGCGEVCTACGCHDPVEFPNFSCCWEDNPYSPYYDADLGGWYRSCPHGCCPFVDMTSGDIACKSSDAPAGVGPCFGSTSCEGCPCPCYCQCSGTMTSGGRGCKTSCSDGRCSGGAGGIGQEGDTCCPGGCPPWDNIGSGCEQCEDCEPCGDETGCRDTCGQDEGWLINAGCLATCGCMGSLPCLAGCDCGCDGGGFSDCCYHANEEHNHCYQCPAGCGPDDTLKRCCEASQQWCGKISGFKGCKVGDCCAGSCHDPQGGYSSKECASGGWYHGGCCPCPDEVYNANECMGNCECTSGAFPLQTPSVPPRGPAGRTYEQSTIVDANISNEDDDAPLRGQRQGRVREWNSKYPPHEKRRGTSRSYPTEPGFGGGGGGSGRPPISTDEGCVDAFGNEVPCLGACCTGLVGTARLDLEDNPDYPCWGCLNGWTKKACNELVDCPDCDRHNGWGWMGAGTCCPGTYSVFSSCYGAEQITCVQDPQWPDCQGYYGTHPTSPANRDSRPYPTVLGEGKGKNIPLAKPLQPAQLTIGTQFQIVNYLADEGLKTLPQSSSEGGFGIPIGGSKSDLSLSETRDSEKQGLPGFEDASGIKAQTIKGSITSTVSSDGKLIGVPLITFVAGSNVRLDTNEDQNIIRMSVDDVNLWELLDVDPKVQFAVDNDVLLFTVVGEVGEWGRDSAQGGHTGGPTGDAPGVTGGRGLTGDIVYNINGGELSDDDAPLAGSTPDFNYSLNPSGDMLLTVGDETSLNFYSGFTSGTTCDISGNTFDSPTFKNTAESVTGDIFLNGETPSHSLLFDWNETISYGTATGGAAGSTYGAISLPINYPPAGVAQTMTLIITNGGLFDLTSDPRPLLRDGVWPGGTAPTLTNDGIDIISVMTIDGGETIYCFLNGTGME